jgi:hypothetical protein
MDWAKGEGDTAEGWMMVFVTRGILEYKIKSRINPDDSVPVLALAETRVRAGTTETPTNDQRRVQTNKRVHFAERSFGWDIDCYICFETKTQPR